MGGLIIAKKKKVIDLANERKERRGISIDAEMVSQANDPATYPGFENLSELERELLELLASCEKVGPKNDHWIHLSSIAPTKEDQMREAWELMPKIHAGIKEMKSK